MKSATRCYTLLILFVVATLIIQAQPPKLNSHLTSTATIFLDFDGQHVGGTSWNWNGDINAQQSGVSNDAITEIYNRVAEDYSPFNLNITTDSAVYFAAPFDKRMRVIITPTYEWYGRTGGISYVGSFNWGNETPAWVFSGLLSYNVKYIAEACSHEVGHTLGLQHQSIYDDNCNKVSEYNEGRGEGEIGWAPIMGIGYYKNLTTWNTGPNTEGCDNIQSDLSIIAGDNNEFGFRNDDHGDDGGVATNIIMTGPSFSVTGLINVPGDIDVFKMRLNTSTNLKLNAIPQNVGYGNAGADIDIKITLQDAQSKTIGVYNPALLLNVGIDTNLNSGNYFIMVTGTGNMNHSAYGSLGFYNLVGNIGVALPVHQFVLKANGNNGNHVLNWTYVADEKIKNIIVEAAADGTNFHEVVSLNPDVRTFSYKPLDNCSYYRLKAITAADERAYYSGISKIADVKNTKRVQLVSNVSNGNIYCISNGVYTYQLFDAGGRMISKGTLTNGMNNIDASHAPTGILLLRIGNGVGSWTERLIKQ